MKALTVKQPWSFAIFHLGKPIENRDWCTTFRGQIAIHTSKKVNGAEFQMSVAAISHIVGKADAVPPQEELPHGQIIGLVDLVDCVVRSDSPWFFGRYGFKFENPISLPKPIPARGALGLWDVPEQIETLILAHIRL